MGERRRPRRDILVEAVDAVAAVHVIGRVAVPEARQARGRITAVLGERPQCAGYSRTNLGLSLQRDPSVAEGFYPKSLESLC